MPDLDHKLVQTAAHLQLTAMRPDYNANSRTQLQSLQQFKPFLNSAVAAHSPTDLPAGPFMIADFGCSTGLNSSDAISHVIGEVRKKYAGYNSTVLVVLNDLPRNPWGELFAFINGDKQSFLNAHPDVFAVTSGSSFFGQVLPDNSLQFGLSTFSLHWCSQLPVKISNHYLANFGTEDERELFRQVAARDWDNFLTARSKELVQGGVLALSFLSSYSEVMNEYYRASEALYLNGTIGSEELGNFNLRMYFRTLDEVTDKSHFDALGLELLRAEESMPTKEVLYSDFLQHGDVNRFAKEFCDFMSAALEPSLFSALSASRSDDDKHRVCDKMRAEFRAKISRQPELFQHSACLIFMAIRKK